MGEKSALLRFDVSACAAKRRESDGFINPFGLHASIRNRVSERCYISSPGEHTDLEPELNAT